MSEQPQSLKSLGGKVGAYRKWRNTADRTAATEPARKAFNRRFEVYPDPEAARKAYYAEQASRGREKKSPENLSVPRHPAPTRSP
jgi:hypothetical protein